MKLFICSLLIVFMIIPGFADNSLLISLFPESNEIVGWQWEEDPVHYSPEKLYEYINGEAELYHSYGFKTLTTLTYFKTSPEDTFITVNIYDMTTPLNAFGIYSNYRYPGYNFDTIGVEAMVSEYDIKYFQDQYFIDISLADESSIINKGAQNIARAISKKIGENISRPIVLSLLPKENQIDKTLKYVRSEMLNQAYLPGGIEAKYMFNDQEVTGFIVIFEDSERIHKQCDKLIQFYLKAGENTQQISSLGKSGVLLSSKYHKGVAFGIKNNYLYGVYGFTNEKLGIKLAESISKQLENK